jgi:hypothetical protein
MRAFTGSVADDWENDKPVGVNKPHSQKSGFFKKPDFKGSCEF